MALLSAMFYSSAFLLREKLRAKFDATTIILWSTILGSLWLLPIMLVRGDRLFPYSWQGWLSVIGLGLCCQAIGQSIITFNLKRFSSSFVSLFLLLEPIMTAIFAWLIFAENLSTLNWVMFVSVLAGIYLASLSQVSEKSAINFSVSQPDEVH